MTSHNYGVSTGFRDNRSWTLLWIVLAFAALQRSKAVAQCDDYSFAISSQSASYVTLHTNSNGQQEEVTVSMTQMPGGLWSNNLLESEDGSASSTFKVKAYGKTIVAKLNHSVTGNTSGSTKSTNGSAQFRLTVNGPSTYPTVSLLIETYKTVIASEESQGSAEFDGAPILVNGRAWATRTQQIVEATVGAAMDLITMSGKATLNGVGQIIANTQINITVANCSDPALRDLINLFNDDDDLDDDEDDPDPSPRKYGSNCDGGTCFRDPPTSWPPPMYRSVPMTIDFTTGNVWTRASILKTFSEDDEEFDFELRYDFQRKDQLGPVGYGWTHSYDTRLRGVNANHADIPPTRCQKLIFWEGNGRRNALIMAGTCGDVYRIPMGRNIASCVWNPSLPPQILLPDGRGHTFDATSGRIVKTTDRRGRITRYTYTNGKLKEVMSPHGRKVTLVYDGPDPNLVHRITSPDDTSTTLDYVNGDLIRITDPLGKKLEYEYDGSHRLTKESVKNNGVPANDRCYFAVYGTNGANVLLDGQSNIVAKVKPTGSIGLPATRTQTVVDGNLTFTDGNGKNWRVRRDNLGRLREFALPTDCAGCFYYREIGYGCSPNAGDNRNRVVSKFDENSLQTKLWWNTLGNLVKKQDAAGNEESYEYTFSLVQTLLTKRIEPDLDTWIYEYYGDNDPNCSGCRRGDLKKITDPLIELPVDAFETFTYETHDPQITGDPTVTGGFPGRIKKISRTDRNGHVETRDYDGKGNPTVLTRAVGTLNLVTMYSHDDMGRETSQTVQRGDVAIVTTSTYDAMGRLLDTTDDPGGLDLLTHREYDGHGNLTLLVNPRGYRTRYEYDHRNRRTTQFEAEGNLNLTTEWTYDGRDNLLTETEANGHVTTHTYDDNGRRVRTVDAESYETRFTVDPAGRVTLVKRALNAGTNGTGSFYTILYEYDAINRLTAKHIGPGISGFDLTTTYEYTAPGGCSCSPATPGTSLPRRISDPRGKVTYIKYDKLDRPVQVIRKVGWDDGPNADGDSASAPDAITQYEYDSGDNMKTIIGPEGERTGYQYDDADRLTLSTVFDSVHGNLVTQFVPDGSGNVKQLTLPGGNIYAVTYDKADRLTLLNDTVGMIIRLTYDENGNVTEQANGLGRTWRYEYDPTDRQIYVLDPIVESPDSYTTFEYDAVGNRIGIINRNGVRTCQTFDGLNRLTAVIEDSSSSCNLGQISQPLEPSPLLPPTANTTTTYGYNGVRQMSITDHNGNTTFYEYDEALRLKKVTYPSPGGVVEYTYDRAGNLATRKDQRLVNTTYFYDDLDHLTFRSYGGGGFASRFETFQFDRSGRLKLADNTAAHIGRTYDQAGRVDTEVQQYLLSPTASYATGYDYVVASGDIRMITNYPGGARSVTRRRDGRGRLQEVLSGVTIRETWTHNLANRRETASRANNIWDFFYYDDDDRLTQLTSIWQAASGDPPPFVSLEDRHYGYDPEGNRLFTSNGISTERSERYSHDNRNRLILTERGVLNSGGTGIVGTASFKQEWTNLDRRGNWLEFKDGVTPVTQTRTVNSMNHYTSVDPDGPSVGWSPWATAYDAAGNLTRDPLAAPAPWYPLEGRPILKYEYDEENRLTRVRADFNDSLLLEYKYDAIGRRVETVDYWNGSLKTRHVCSGIESIQEYVCCGSASCGAGIPACGTSWLLAREFVWGDSKRFPEPVAMIDYTGAGQGGTGVPAGGFVYHYLRDALGSVVGLTDAAGSLVERYQYDPYGKPLIEKWNPVVSQWEESIGAALGPASALGNPFLWTGQRYDTTTGLYDFLFRSFSPSWGRWLQPDPLGYVGGISLYEYVNSSPYFWVDPLGLTSVTHGQGDGWRVDSEVVPGSGNVHVQSGGNKYYYNPVKDTFHNAGDGSRVTGNVDKAIRSNPQRMNAISHGVNRVQSQGNRVFRIGPKTSVTVTLVVGFVIAEATDSLAAISNGQAYRQLLLAIANGDIAAADRWAEELYEELLASGNKYAALHWQIAWEKRIKPRIMKELQRKREDEERRKMEKENKDKGPEAPKGQGNGQGGGQGGGGQGGGSHPPGA